MKTNDIFANSYTAQNELRRVKVIYEFRHSKMGFQNQVTVDAISDNHAIENASREVSEVYGSKMLPRFTFKVLTAN